MAGKKEQKFPQKYRFIEDFPEAIDPETGEVREDIGSPDIIKTDLFGKLELHKIAKVRWREVKVTQEFDSIGPNGEEQTETRELVTYEPEMGDAGGWIEKYENLDQLGECWVEEGAVVVGEAFVSGDAKILSGAEIGEKATVKGEAVVSGPVGVCGKSYVLDKGRVYGKLVNGKKIFSVKDHAKVRGEVKGASVVYGEAEIAKDGELIEASTAYDKAYVNGRVEKESTIYGNAVINGTVKGSKVFGDTVVEKTGTVLNSSIRKGKIAGTFEKSYVYDVAIFSFGKKSLAKECHFHSGLITIGENCVFKDCTFRGLVDIEKTTAEKSDFKDCFVSDCEIFFGSINNSHVEKTKVRGEEKSSHGMTDIDTSRVAEVTLSGCNILYQGIPPKGANWEFADFSGITNEKTVVGKVKHGSNPDEYVTMSGVTHSEIATPRILDKPVDRKYYPVHWEKVYTPTFNSSGKTYKGGGEWTGGWKKEFGKEQVLFARDYTNYGEESFDGITVFNEEDGEFLLKKYLKDLEEEHKEEEKIEAAYKKRYDYVKGVEDRLDNMMENIKKTEESIGAQIQALSNRTYAKDSDFPTDRYNALLDQLDDNYRKEELIKIARDVVGYNLYSTPGYLRDELDFIWNKKVYAIGNTISGLPNSVTPTFAYTVLHVHTFMDEDEPLTEFEGDFGGDHVIPDFTQPVTLPTITQLSKRDTVTRIVSKFLANSPFIVSKTAAWAEYFYHDKNAAYRHMSFSDLVKYTEDLKFGYDSDSGDSSSDSSDSSDSSSDSDESDAIYI